MPRHPFICALLAITCCTGFALGQQPTTQQTAGTLLQVIQKNHFAPRPVDDLFSADVFDALLSELDPRGLLFIKPEYDQLATTYRNKIDDELNGEPWKFLPQLSVLYLNALKRSDSISTAVIKSTFNFTEAQSVTIDKNARRIFAVNNAELAQRWTKWAKWQTLGMLADLAPLTAPASTWKDVYSKNVSDIRTDLKDAAQNLFTEERNASQLTAELGEQFLTTVAKCFDPHTNYFSPQEKEQFQEALSTEDKSFGFAVAPSGEKVVVGELVPGGSAWKTGDLHRNDQVLELKFDNQPPVDVKDWDAEDVAELIETTSAQALTIKTLKGDGTTTSITLQKEKLEQEEDKVKSFVLQGPQRIGYISLPDFYTVWGKDGGTSCADDVAKEVVKLKKENVTGIILDVRYNGGGSMQEALALTGIFIGEGPLLGVRQKDGKTVYLKDPNRGTIWDGPLVVMINGQSASASEALAAALQDYQRAVIVGSTSYGKATMQQLLPLDENNPAAGYVKVTAGKLYRLTGSTIQQQGVQPDVLLPDAFEALKYKERFSAHALAADNVEANKWYKPLPPLPLATVAQSSKDRVNGEPGFTSTTKYIADYNRLTQTAQTVPLRFEDYQKWRAQNNSIIRERKTEITTPAFTLTNHRADREAAKQNAYTAALNQSWEQRLSADAWLHEAYRVINQLIATK